MTNPCLQTACDALGWKLLEPMGDGQPRIDVGWGAFEVGHPALVGPMLEAIRKVRRLDVECDDDSVCAWMPLPGKDFQSEDVADAVLAAFLEVFGK